MSSLKKTNEHEKNGILEGSKKLAKLDDYISSKKDHNSTISHQSLPMSNLDIDLMIEKKFVPFGTQMK
jgi:hypothetical protein